MVFLDATMGNRKMWPNKNPPDVIFMDKEHDLLYKPHVIADFRYCPFRDGVFECVFFDPPYFARLPPPWFMNKQIWPDNKSFSYYGRFKDKVDMFSSIHKAQEEFKRLTERICFKWMDLHISLWKVLPLFRDWKIIQKKKHQTVFDFANKKGKNPTWWVTMISRSSLRKAISDSPENDVSDILLGSQVIENGATPTTN